MKKKKKKKRDQNHKQLKTVQAFQDSAQKTPVFFVFYRKKINVFVDIIGHTLP